MPGPQSDPSATKRVATASSTRDDDLTGRVASSEMASIDTGVVTHRTSSCDRRAVEPGLSAAAWKRGASIVIVARRMSVTISPVSLSKRPRVASVLLPEGRMPASRSFATCATRNASFSRTSSVSVAHMPFEVAPTYDSGTTSRSASGLCAFR